MRGSVSGTTEFSMQHWIMKVSLAMALALTLGAPAARADAADPAAAPVQSFYATLLECMKAGKALGVQGRYEKLKPSIAQSFDPGTMIKYAVGPAWDTAAPADQKALTEAFTRMTISQYAGNFDSYNGEKFTVDPKADIRGSDHYLKSALVTRDQTVTFTYRMRQFGGQWKIIDVLLEGSISQLTVYRSDYTNTLKVGGAQALIQKINTLADKSLKS